MSLLWSEMNVMLVLQALFKLRIVFPCFGFGYCRSLTLDFYVLKKKCNKMWNGVLGVEFEDFGGEIEVFRACW